MKKFYLGLALGVLASSLVFIPLIKVEQRDKQEFGYNQGSIAGVIYATDKIRQEFGSWDERGDFTRLFSAKMATVVSIEVNGVKTIRVSDPMPVEKPPDNKQR